MSGARSTRGRLLDALLVALLAGALVQAALLADGGPVRAYVPLLAAGDAPGSLQGEGAADRALAARAAAVGEIVTVEDLARGVLALREGALPGVEPLSSGEAEAVDAALRSAAEHRAELLRVEGEIAAVEAEMQARARAIAATLSPEQRAWIVARRDAVSVGEVEQAYWDELLAVEGGGGAEARSGASAPPPERR